MKRWIARRYWGYTLIVGGYTTRDDAVMKAGIEIFFGVQLP